MDAREAQDRVVKAVRMRGYRGKWTALSFLARQLAKLQEELAEAIWHVRDGTPKAVMTATRIAGDQARREFDHGYWNDWRVRAEEMLLLVQELADIQVVLYNAASALEEATGIEVNLAEAAVRKAEGDVKRGVRSQIYVDDADEGGEAMSAGIGE